MNKDIVKSYDLNPVREYTYFQLLFHVWVLRTVVKFKLSKNRFSIGPPKYQV